MLPLAMGDVPALQENVLVIGYPTGGDNTSVTRCRGGGCGGQGSPRGGAPGRERAHGRAAAPRRAGAPPPGPKAAPPGPSAPGSPAPAARPLHPPPHPSGVVSRVEVTQYVHAASHLMAIQIDAAINPGNRWAGQRGRWLGVGAREGRGRQRARRERAAPEAQRARDPHRPLPRHPAPPSLPAAAAPRCAAPAGATRSSAWPSRTCPRPTPSATSYPSCAGLWFGGGRRGGWSPAGCRFLPRQRPLPLPLPPRAPQPYRTPPPLLRPPLTSPCSSSPPVARRQPLPVGGPGLRRVPRLLLTRHR
jgi:hypothetical protein